ncbi:hypothetical protein, partial [Halomonas casei]|uniref:hypothetical protein n=2 Tax=Halomonas casei TaxID=2742613 RepID=UPI0039F0D9BA
MSLQNEPLTSADGYAETAYRADAIPEQSYAPQNEMLRGRILETRLPWGSYLGINPTTYQYSESWFWEYQYIGDDYHDYTMINELRWSWIQLISAAPAVSSAPEYSPKNTWAGVRYPSRFLGLSFSLLTTLR